MPESVGLAHYQVVDDIAPKLANVLPRPGGSVRELKRIRLFFSEPVTGFEVDDIQINGQVPASVTGFADGPWEVEFKKIKRGSVVITWPNTQGITDQAANPNVFAGRDWSYNVDPDHSPGVVVINELVASNQSGLRDEDDQAADWIELKNTGHNTVNLGGWSLTNDKDDPGKWTFPDIEIKPKKFLVVFASGKNRRVVGKPMHTNFKLRLSLSLIHI